MLSTPEQEILKLTLEMDRLCAGYFSGPAFEQALNDCYGQSPLTKKIFR